MSRTFRRKNYEQQNQSSWSNHGRKLAGYYTEVDYVYGYEDGGEYWRHWSNPIYRVPTEKERAEKYWKIHGESKTANSWSPGRSYRKMRMRENRSRNKQEVIKFMKNPDYEPICESDPRNCWWDWS